MKNQLLTHKSSGLGEVDSVKVTVMVDNNVPFGLPYTGEHGFSLFVEVSDKNKTNRIMLDTGRTSENFSQNVTLANVPVEEIGLVYISHCHHDHTGGLEWLLEQKKSKTTIVSHPSLFRNTFKLKGEIKSLSSKASKENIEKLGGNLYLIKDPIELMPGVISSGEINRTTDFEGMGIGTYSVDDAGNLTEDLIMDDMALIVNVKGKGLLILAGCSHAGIINIVKHAKDITGIDKIYGIVGGLHLISATDELITKTIDELLIIAPEHLYAGHCTGFKAMKILSEKFGDTFEPLGTGMKFQF